MSKIGRNDPCPSGAGIKFKKCLVKHPELRADSPPEEIWWVCDRWQASLPDYQKLLAALTKQREVGPEKMEAFFEHLFELPPETIDWAKAIRTVALAGGGNVVDLHDRVVEHISSTVPSAMPDVLAIGASIFATQAPERLPGLVESFISVGEDGGVSEMAIRDVYLAVERAGLVEESDRLLEAFPEVLQENQVEDEVSDKEPGGQDSYARHGKPAFEEGLAFDSEISPEVEERVEELWARFRALEQPTVEEMDEFVGNLLEEPFEATCWEEVLNALRRSGHPDLLKVFHRIQSEIKGIGEARPAFLCWGAMECFVAQAKTDLLPEVASTFAELDVETYSPGALSHCLDYMLYYGFEADTLTLAERFLPVMREDASLLPHAVDELIEIIFDLRVGRFIQEEAIHEKDSEELVRRLLQGIKEEMRRDVALRAVAAVKNEPPIDQVPFPRSAFELAQGDTYNDPGEHEQALRLFGMLIRIADEQWRLSGALPGCQLHGFRRLLKMAYQAAQEDEGATGKRNLLDYMDPAGMEGRIAQSSPDLMGINEQKAALLIQAHRSLIDTFRRHGLISAGRVAKCRSELDRLTKRLGTV